MGGITKQSIKRGNNRRKKYRYHTPLAVAMAVLMAVSIINLNAVLANEEKTENPYPYTIFAASKEDGAVYFDATNCCINGSVATNGTISSTGNVNINGGRKEKADEEMIYIFNAIEEKYYQNSEAVFSQEEYVLEEQNINICKPIYSENKVCLLGNVNLTSCIKALDDISIDGEVDNTADSMLFSKYGDIVIDSTNVNLNGLVYAPFGLVKISAQNLTLNNVIIIADKVIIESGSINANYGNSVANFVGYESEKLYIPEDEKKYVEGKPEFEENTEESGTEENSSEEGSEEPSEDASEDLSEEPSEDATEEPSGGDFSDWYDRYDEWANMTDTDGDGLPDDVEKSIGSNENNVDTDDDGLDDYFELLVLGTSPVDVDTDKNGVSDYDEDADNDGLTNGEEYELGTFVWERDTDDDNLCDGDEVKVYNTDPFDEDTDKDGVLDGEEPSLGLDPLKYDTDEDNVPDGEEYIRQDYECEIEKEPKGINKVLIASEATGNLAYRTSVTSLMDVDAACSNVVGLFGEPFEIETSSHFESAELTFMVDMDSLGDTDFEDLMFLWYDEENGVFVELDTEHDAETGAVSTKVNHFSKYMLVNVKKWLHAWNENKEEDSEEEEVKYATEVCIDFSGISPLYTYEDDIAGDKTDFNVDERFDEINDEFFAFQDACVDICKTLSGKMSGENRMELLFMMKRAYTYSDFYQIPEDKAGFMEEFEDLEGLYKEYYNGNFDAPGDNFSVYGNVISLCASELSGCYGKDKDVEKNMIIITNDTGKMPDNYALYRAAADNVKINVLVLDEIDDYSVFEYITGYTGGKIYKAFLEDELADFYIEMGEHTMSPTADYDKDGLPDILEKDGMRNQFGEVIYTEFDNPDSDGDGLLDGEEMNAAPVTKCGGNKYSHFIPDGTIYYYMHSNPNKVDSDGDGYSDYEEVYGIKGKDNRVTDPMYNDVRIYSLSEEFVEVGCNGEIVWNNQAGGTLSFGGDQGWFEDAPYPDSNIIDRTGCGLISVADKLLYLSKVNSKFETDFTKLAIQEDKDENDLDNKKRIVYCYDYESYLNYVSELNSTYFMTSKNGWMGTFLSYYWNLYMSANGTNLYATWGVSEGNILPKMKEMLSNDIPVTLSVGPAKEFFEDVVDEENIEDIENLKDIETLDDLKIAWKQDERVTLFYYKEGKWERSFSKNHYITVTGLKEDGVAGNIWMEVSSWGKKYYMRYDDYIHFISNHNATFSNILYIYEGN